MNPVLALARPDILELQPYAHAKWDPSLERMHANEMPWRAQGDNTSAGLNRYPEPQPHALVERMARLYDVPASRCLVGRGSDEAIDLLVRAFCRAGTDSVVICPPTFGFYKVAARVQGAEVVEVPLLDAGFALDTDAVIDAGRRARIVFLCSPNNPTGNLLDERAILSICSALAAHALVCVDEAYIEFSNRASLSSRLDELPNLVVLRTLSKAYALAGARCGTLIAGEEMLEASQAVVRVLPSDANFLLVQCRDAARFLEAGKSVGLLVRDFSSAPRLNGCLRISVGTPEQNERLLDAVERS